MYTIRFACKECGRTVTVEAGKPLVCPLCGHDNALDRNTPPEGTSKDAAADYTELEMDPTPDEGAVEVGRGSW